MSRRASLFAKQNPGKPRVRFPDELVFEDNIKENDLQGMQAMLRRTSLKMDINGINKAGLTPLHQAVLDGNFPAVRILLRHGASVNTQDEDTWTPLHAACAEGNTEIIKFLLKRGADANILTDEGERPIDLIDPSDLGAFAIMLPVTKPKHNDESEEEEEDEDDDENNNNDDDCDEKTHNGNDEEDEDECHKHVI